MRLVAYLILGLSFIFATPSLADYYDTSVMQCDAFQNLAIVRIGGHENEHPPTYPGLPAAYGPQWNKVTEANTAECRLANGEHLVFKQGLGQAFAYGEGGGDPPVWISLWLDNRRLLTRFEVKPGYGDYESRIVTSLIYTPGQLRICDIESNWAKYDKRPRAPVMRDSDSCYTKPVKKSALTYDSLHNYNQKAAIGTISTAAAYSPAFCKRFVYPAEMFEHGPWDNALLRGEKEALSFLPLKATDLPINGYEKRAFFEGSGGGPWGDLSDSHLALDYFDFDNDGRQDTVIVASDGRNYIDGEIFLVKSGHMAKSAEVFTLRDAKQYEEWARLNGWSVYSGLDTPYHTDRYTHFRAFRLNGATYLMATPARRELRPSAVLYQPLPDGKLDALCFYQVIEDKF